MHVVPVGVDQELFRPLDDVARIPGRLITTASADVTMKGLKYLLEALAKLRTERRRSRWSSSAARRKAACRRAPSSELGLGGCVEFVTGVTEERIIELYSEAEVAVVPSLYEGFSLPAIEAMSCGVPLVATTGGALPEVVGNDNETALLVPPGDSEALAARIATRPRRPRAAEPASAWPAASGSSTAGPGATRRWAPSSTTGPCWPRPPTSRADAPVARWPPPASGRPLRVAADEIEV